MMALDGIRILDLTYLYPGPFCSMILGDLGAEVIKIETPGTGDQARQSKAFFNSINRNKKSLTLNLKKPAGKEIFYKLVPTADVFTEGSRPGVVHRLGIDYKTLRSINPKIIYCSISGYGQDGPYKELPGHDINYLSISGMLGMFRDNDNKIIVPRVAIGDLSAGMFATVGILAALVARQKIGEGQYIDISMTDGLVSWMSTLIGVFLSGGLMEVGTDSGYGIFATKDGGNLSFGIAYEDWFWENLCKALDLSEYSGLKLADRIRRKEEIRDHLESIFLKKNRDEWFNMLSKWNVPVSPVYSLNEVINDPQVLHREMVVDMENASGQIVRQTGIPVKLSCTPGKIKMKAPALGEHTEELLLGLGFDQKRIEQLREEGVI